MLFNTPGQTKLTEEGLGLELVRGKLRWYLSRLVLANAVKAGERIEYLQTGKYLFLQLERPE